MKNFKIKGNNGKEYWISRSIAVHGILMIHHEGGQKYLLQERRGSGCPDEVGKWANPTGYLDWGETLEEGLYREVWEELGLDLKKVPHEISFFGIYDKPVGRQNVTVRYMVDIRYEDIDELLFNETINPRTEERGGERDEVSDIALLKISPRNSLVDPKEFAFDHGELVNKLIKYFNE